MERRRNGEEGGFQMADLRFQKVGDCRFKRDSSVAAATSEGQKIISSNRFFGEFGFYLLIDGHFVGQGAGIGEEAM